MNDKYVLRRNFKFNGGAEDTRNDALTSAQTAQYISDLVLEMRNLAKAADLKLLQGFLELTYYEAYAAAHRVDVPDGEEDRLVELGEDARRAERKAG